MIKKKLVLLYFLLCHFQSFSQDGWDSNPGFGSGEGDPATEPLKAPIDSIEVPLFITGVLFAIYVIRKKNRQLTNN